MSRRVRMILPALLLVAGCGQKGPLFRPGQPATKTTTQTATKPVTPAPAATTPAPQTATQPATPAPATKSATPSAPQPAAPAKP